jgi:hypothetical protein
MSRKILRTLAGASMVAGLLAATPALAQGCTRDSLKELAAKYVEAQTQGKSSVLPLGNWVVYRENFKLASLSTDTLSKPLKIDWSRALLDTTQCRVALHMIATDPADPMVIAVQFQGFGGSASNFSVIPTDEDDWLFDAKMTYEYARREDWFEIPEDKRNTRAELQAAADAYLNLFKDKATPVPWGTPCRRLEGAVYTGRGQADDSCNVGVPENIDMIDRQYVIDPVLGAVDVFLKMGPNKRADSHRFRIEDGKIRFVHTVTNCNPDPNCGFGDFREMLKRNPQMQPDPALFD